MQRNRQGMWEHGPGATLKRVNSIKKTFALASNLRRGRKSSRTHRTVDKRTVASRVNPHCLTALAKHAVLAPARVKP